MGLTAVLDNVKREVLSLPGFEHRPLGRPGLSQSLYRLRYSGSPVNKYIRLKINIDIICNVTELHLKHLENTRSSELVWDCHQSLIQLARHNRVQPMWVPVHEGIAGNETDLLARSGSEHPFTGPEPACGVSNSKGTYIRTVCQKNKGSVEIKLRPITVDSRTIYRTLSSKGTPFQIGIDG
jgi:hypothetical protein